MKRLLVFALLDLYSCFGITLLITICERIGQSNESLFNSICGEWAGKRYNAAWAFGPDWQWEEYLKTGKWPED